MLLRLLAIVLASSAVCMAQAPTDGQPAPSNALNAPYPRINADHTVTFRVRADAAQKVGIALGGGPVNLECAKGTDGFWTATSKPLEPGFYYYTVVVDGFTSADPGSSSFFGYGRFNSAVEVPGAESEFFAPKDVPHG